FTVCCFLLIFFFSSRRRHTRSKRDWSSDVCSSDLDLKVPRTRSGEFSTDVFEKYERCDQALILSMLEMVVNGVSTRKIANITKRLYGETVSKSTVSKLTEKLNPIVKE